MKIEKLITLAIVSVVTVCVSLTAQAIVWGDEDLNNNYPNVVSLTGIDKATDGKYNLKIRCSGSLLHRDNKKFVFLTAGHCTSDWTAQPLSHKVGVSFDQNNQPAWKNNDAPYYVNGGIPISSPDKGGNNRERDLGLVVFPANATNADGLTIIQEWDLSNVNNVRVLGNTTELQNIINSVKNPTNNLYFTVVGYGTGEKMPIPGQETGPATPNQRNDATFMIRYFADRLSFNTYHPISDVIGFSQNRAKNENGACNGDSGGPIFYEGGNLRIQVAVVSGGALPCSSTLEGPSFNRPEAVGLLKCAKDPSLTAQQVQDCVANVPAVTP
jgi:secreted trypsin-like serine protease